MPIFLEKKYSLEQVLLQSEEELLARRSSDIVSEGVAPKPKKIIGKMKVQSIVMYFLFFIFMHFHHACTKFVCQDLYHLSEILIIWQQEKWKWLETHLLAAVLHL